MPWLLRVTLPRLGRPGRLLVAGIIAAGPEGLGGPLRPDMPEWGMMASVVRWRGAMDHDVNAELEHVLAAARELLERARIEVTTVWLPIQLGLIALAAGIGYVAAVAVRRRFDPRAVSVKWPPMARQLARVIAEDL